MKDGETRFSAELDDHDEHDDFDDSNYFELNKRRRTVHTESITKMRKE